MNNEEKVTAKYQLAISDKKALLKPLLDKMEELRVEVLAPTVRYLKEFYEKEVKRFLSEESEVAAKLSLEQMKQFKSDIHALKDDAESFMSERFKNNKLWWHISPTARPIHDVFSRLSTNETTHGAHGLIHFEIRIAMGRLGPILNKYGISKPSFWTARGTELPAYPYGFDWSTEVSEVMERYGVIFAQASTLTREISELEDEFEKEITRTRWDAA